MTQVAHRSEMESQGSLDPTDPDPILLPVLLAELDRLRQIETATVGLDGALNVPMSCGGVMVIPGDAEGSNLVVLMEGRADPSISMPHGESKPVPAKDIQTIRIWVEQGAKNN